MEARGELLPRQGPGGAWYVDRGQVEALSGRLATSAGSAIPPVPTAAGAGHQAAIEGAAVAAAQAGQPDGPAGVGPGNAGLGRLAPATSPEATWDQSAVARLEGLVTALTGEVERLNSEVRLHRLRLDAVGGRINAIEAGSGRAQGFSLR
jgi:hypothetical protein